MAKSDDLPIKFSNKCQVARQMEQIVYPIPDHDWKRIIKRIRKCGLAKQPLDSIFWGCVGLASSAAISFLGACASGQRPAFWYSLILGSVAIGGFGVAATVHVLSKSQNKVLADSHELIAEDMESITKRFVVSGKVNESGEPEILSA